MQIQWAGTPNFTAGRKGRKVIAIVDHITQGLMPGCLSWMQNPSAKASAHYLVTRKGEIYQLVKDEDTAWHAGIADKPNWPLYDKTNPNYYTIGIEHEGMTGEPLTEEQYQASLWLHQQLIKKHCLQISNNAIIGHYRIDSVNRPNCPGSAFPWNKLFEDLKGGKVLTDITVTVKGKEITGKLIDDVAYAPVRLLVEMLNYQVVYDATDKAVDIK